MAQLLVIADDLTGALDSGVQLAGKGDHVLVSLDCEQGLSYAEAADVLVIDSESRHDAPEVAADKVARLVRGARELGIERLYKKTDSGLRGNVGAELAAALEATEADCLHFVPAYPKQQRTTENGIQYVAGVPLERSIFAADPTNPVTRSRVGELIALQSDVEVCAWDGSADQTGIVVHDCATDEDMREIAAWLGEHAPAAPLAGCAGLLEMLPACAAGHACSSLGLASDQVAVVSGSANAVTASQLDEAQRRGAYRASLPLHQILAGDWSDAHTRAFVLKAIEEGADSPVILIDTLGELLTARELADESTTVTISCVAGACAACVRELSDRTTMVVGGDALVSFIEQVGATLLEPLHELFPGIVVARYEGSSTEGTLVTKSGAFGDVGLFMDVHEALKEKLGGER